jgi:hypothetical protein
LTSDLVAFRNVFNAAKNPAPQAGNHTFTLQNPAAEPATIASGNVSISKSGTAQIHGSLSTGQKFSLSSAVWEGGAVPFFVSIGKGTDVFAGGLVFDAPDITGEVDWSHAGSSGVVVLQQQ